MRRLAGFKRINLHRLGDILQGRGAEIADLEIELLLHLTIGVLGKTDRPWLGDPSSARRDIDVVAHEIAVVLLDHVADMNADAQLDAPTLGMLVFRLTIAALYLYGATHGVDHAAELDDPPSPARLTTRP